MKVILVCTKFFGYEQQIAESLRRLGHQVVLLEDRHWNGFVGKSIARFFPILYRFFNCRRLIRKLGVQAPSVGPVDRIIVIQGVSISSSFLSRLKRINPIAQVHLYLWDSIANRRNSLCLMRIADHVYSFDPGDCRRYNIVYKTLFFCTTIGSHVSASSKSGKLFFLGTDRGDRYPIAKSVAKEVGFANCDFTFYVESRLRIYLRRLLLLGKTSVDSTDFILTPVPYAEVIKRMAESKMVLDVEHPHQQGLTIRTFEALGMGKKIITTNKNIQNHEFFDSRNILILDRQRVKVPIEFWETPLVPLKDAVLKKYSIDEWVLDFVRER